MNEPSTEAQRFEILYRAHYAAIVRFVHRRTDAASAEEIVAETFVVAWRRLDDVPADPLPWLYVVARNLLHGERRSTVNARDKAARLALGWTRRPTPISSSTSSHGRDPLGVPRRAGGAC